nr:unnamed protein product [Callosobruchus chinensis]
MQSREGQFDIDDPALTCHLQPPSHRRAIASPTIRNKILNSAVELNLTIVVPIWMIDLPYRSPSAILSGRNVKLLLKNIRSVDMVMEVTIYIDNNGVK